MKKKALIFGITGQDGYYMLEFLIKKPSDPFLLFWNCLKEWHGCINWRKGYKIRIQKSNPKRKRKRKR